MSTLIDSAESTLSTIREVLSDMRLIPLTRGLYAVVDDADFDRLGAHRWRALPGSKGSTTFYAIRTAGRAPNRRTVLMHREILRVTDDTLQVDHRDMDGLNNRRSNLRLATQSQNNANRIRSEPGLRRRHGKWCSRITCNGRDIELGTFATAHEAMAAYWTKAKELFGEFAKTPDDATGLA